MEDGNFFLRMLPWFCHQTIFLGLLLGLFKLIDKSYVSEDLTAAIDSRNEKQLKILLSPFIYTILNFRCLRVFVSISFGHEWSSKIIKKSDRVLISIIKKYMIVSHAGLTISLLIVSSAIRTKRRSR